MFWHMHCPSHTWIRSPRVWWGPWWNSSQKKTFSAVYYCCFPCISTFLNWLFSNISYCHYLSVFNSTWEMIDEIPREGEAFQRVVVGDNKNKVPSLLLQHNFVYAALQTSLLLNDISCVKVKPPCAAWSSQHRLGLTWALYRCKLTFCHPSFTFKF